MITDLLYFITTLVDDKRYKKYIERQTRLTSGGVGVSKLTFF